MQNPGSNVASTLLGLFLVKDSSNYAPTDPEFTKRYKKAITKFIQEAYQLDNESPLTCAALGGYFLPRQEWEAVEILGRKAIQMTDVNAVASDGWYLLAQKEHYQPQPNWPRVVDFYNRADLARGGGEIGYPPAKFGMAQAQVLNHDRDGAKFRLERLAQKSYEAKVLLGTLYAEEAFDGAAPAGAKDDRKAVAQKAIAMLSTVRLAWSDPKKNLQPDVNVLLTLARLYESDAPDKALQCLLEVQKMSLDDLKSDLKYADVDDDDLRRQKMRAHLPPQLLNNIACFQYRLERFGESTETFQLALNACMNLKEEDNAEESDQLVTSISYNLARSYEGAGELEEAKKVYENLRDRYADYTDAQTRLAQIALRQSPHDEGPKTMAKLYEAESSNIEVRGLYGWYLNRHKRRGVSLAEDPEARVYRHTLQYHHKHNVYALTGLGNLHLAIAREMRRDNEQEREKRRKTYEKAVGFFVQALNLDPRNAYAAQGIAIAQAEDQRNLASAIQILTKVRETVRDSGTLVNLGHAHCERKQYARAIEMYEAAVARDRGRDPQVLAALGRAAFLQGKTERSMGAMKAALAHSVEALQLAPGQAHFEFNVAFVQMQLAQLVYGLPEAQRTLADLEAALQGLHAAVDAVGRIARGPRPPYPRPDLEQRAAMGRNTMTKQLDRAVAAQRDYEAANAEKVAAARAARELAARERAEAQQRADDAAAADRRRILEKRAELMERSRQLAEERAHEERARDEAEYTTNSEGERVRRKRKARGGAAAAGGKRKKKSDDVVDDADDFLDDDLGLGASGTGSGDGGAPREASPKKKRKLARRNEGKPSKFKSAEVVDSDDEADDVAVAAPSGGRDAFDLSEDDAAMSTTMEDEPGATQIPDGTAPADHDTEMQDVAAAALAAVAPEEDDDEAAAVPARKGKAKPALDDEEDEDE